MAAATILPTPFGRRVKVIEQGAGAPVVFLHSGVGSAGERKQVFSLWPEGYRQAFTSRTSGQCTIRVKVASRSRGRLESEYCEEVAGPAAGVLIPSPTATDGAKALQRRGAGATGCD